MAVLEIDAVQVAEPAVCRCLSLCSHSRDRCWDRTCHTLTFIDTCKDAKRLQPRFRSRSECYRVVTDFISLKQPPKQYGQAKQRHTRDERDQEQPTRTQGFHLDVECLGRVGHRSQPGACRVA